MIRSKEPLMDDDGKEFAEVVVRLILYLSNTEGKIQKISIGSEWGMSYVLLQGSQSTLYRGYPNYIIQKQRSVGAAIVITKMQCYKVEYMQ